MHPAQRFLTSTAANQVTIDGEVRGESITAMTLRHPVDCYFDHCVVLYETSEISPSLPVR